MSPVDTLRVVTFEAPHFEAKRPTLSYDLTAPPLYVAEGGSPSFEPPERERGKIILDSPWAGEVSTLDRSRNGHMGVTLRVLAASPEAQINAAVAAILTAPPRSAIEHRRASGIPTYYPLMGDATWEPTYSINERRQGAGMVVRLVADVAPTCHHGSMDIYDDYSVDSLSDYTVDQGTGLIVTTGSLWPGNTTEKRLTYSARGYTYADAQATVKLHIGPTVAGTEVYLRLKKLDNSNWIEAGLSVPAGGVGIWKFDNGTRTQLDPGTGFTPSASTTIWVRHRIEGNVVVVEVFTSEPTPMSTPVQTSTHTLSGADATKFGAGVLGGHGLRWAPGSDSQAIDEYSVRPFTYRNRTLPEQIQLGGAVPGDAPAQLDLEITPSGGAAAPVFGLVAPAPRPAAGTAPFGILEAESAGDLAGWVVQADVGSRGGSRLIDTTPTSGETYTASWTVDPTLFPLQDSHEWEVEVWGLVALSNSLVTPKLAVSARPLAGLDFGATRYTEHGTAGKALVLPTAAARRFTPLGRLSLSQAGDAYKLFVTGTLGAGSGGSTWGLDYLMLFPTLRRARSPVGVALDANYPKFVRSTAETTRTILHDLRSLTAKPPGEPIGDVAMIGSRVTLEPGGNDLLVKLSSLVPDDPTANATTEQLAHQATVHVPVLPQFFYS